MNTHRIGEWKNVGSMTIPKSTTEEDLAVALLDMLDQLGYNWALSCNENACRVLGHPDANDGRCYCRQVKYP